MKVAKVGLLPLYLKLYDVAMPEVRPGCEAFVESVASALTAEGLVIVRTGLCCVEAEVRAAIDEFKVQEVDLLVTLHAAYSPSLEAFEPLLEWPRPILLLDTTPDFCFGQDISPEHIMLNHGVHGVQDLAAVLRRRGRAYDIVAGHWRESSVLSRVAGRARAAVAARALGRSRVLRIGNPFEGMGDFAVDEDALVSHFGIHVDTIAAADLATDMASVTEAVVEEERRADENRFVCRANPAAHRRSICVGLGLRRRLEQGRHTALTMNFLSFGGTLPVSTVPFLEACKAMGRGLGYAGECDALTAALVGALNSGFGDTTFTEVFCPDWEGNALFLSHMGEFNVSVCAGKAVLCEKPFPWSRAENPVVAAGAFRPGSAVLANLAPGPDESFRLVIAEVDVLPDRTGPEMSETIRAWVRPSAPLPEFLEWYSVAGGTHHSALVFGVTAEDLAAFGRCIGVETVDMARLGSAR